LIVMRPFYASGIAVAAATLLATTGLATLQSQAPDAQPSVVLIMAEDIGYRDIGAYGAVDIKTPALDKLASEGTQLTDFYAAGLSSGTRAALMTGRYPQRTPVDGDVAADDSGLPVNGRSLPQLLKGSGYTTGLVGKWGLGRAPTVSPNAHGFDAFFGFKGDHIDYYTHAGGDGQPDLWENGAAVQRRGYITDLITAQSLRFLEQNARRRLFLEVSYSAAHWPYQPPNRPGAAAENTKPLLPHDPNPGTRADYAAMVERMDLGIGQILQKLDQLGLARNTVVIFTSDTGGDWLSDNSPLFHRRGTVWEGGIRVPTIIRWPGTIPAGRSSDQVGTTMDLTASILAATGTTVPDGARLEGLDLLPILEGHAAEMPRTLFWRTPPGARNVQRAARSGDWKLVVDSNHIMVFDIRKDVAEQRDLANRRQDIAHRLCPLIAQWETEVNAEGGGGRGAARGGAPAAARGGAAPAGRGAAPAAGRGAPPPNVPIVGGAPVACGAGRGAQPPQGG
jgi:arylsulfatase A-like enzyme